MERQREQVEKHGHHGKGRSELLKHLGGKSVTMKGAILAKCYDCMGYYSDGRIDCRVPGCSLYPYMPYREQKPAPQKHLTPDQRAQIGARLKKGREARSKTTPTFGLGAFKQKAIRNHLPQDDTTPVSGVLNRNLTEKLATRTEAVSEPGTGPQNTPTFGLAGVPVQAPEITSTRDDRR